MKTPTIALIEIINKFTPHRITYKANYGSKWGIRITDIDERHYDSTSMAIARKDFNKLVEDLTDDL